MEVSMSWRIFTFVLAVTSAWARPLGEDEDNTGEDASATKTVNDEDFVEIVMDLEEIIAALPLELFSGDTMLFQVIDTLNDVTMYKANGTSKKEPSIFERQYNDKDKRGIVLKPSEDKIAVRKEKRTFVGLRSTTEESAYYVFYIYLRDPATGDDIYVKKIGGVDRLVEYDSWENREDKVQKVNNGLGWDECVASIFIPCKTPEHDGMAPPRIDHRNRTKAHEVESTTVEPPKPEGHFKTEEGFDPDENVDFFWDMEEDIQKARFIGIGLNLLSGGLKEIPTLLNGVFGGIVEGIGGLLSGVIGMAGKMFSSFVNMGAQVVNGIITTAGGMVSGSLKSVFGLSDGLLGSLGIKVGVGDQVADAVDMGTKFATGMTTAVAQGASAVAEGGSQLAQAGVGVGVAVAKTGVAVAGGVLGIFLAGLGLVNSLLSFGGLGGPQATSDSVGPPIGINLNLGGLFGGEKQEVQEGLQRPESGGLGGLLSLDVSLEAPSPNGSPPAEDPPDYEPPEGAPPADDAPPVRKREIDSNQLEPTQASNSRKPATTEQEVAQIDERTVNKIIAKLAEIMAIEMGDNFGKEILKTGLVEHPGWKTMDEAGAPGNTLSHEDDAFVGFGSCQYRQVGKEDYNTVGAATDLMLLLTSALRTQCVTKELKMFHELLMDGFLVYNEADKVFDVPADCKYLHLEKLNPRRRSDLARAFEMDLFSKIFKAELFTETPHSAPVKSSISRRVYTFGEVILQGIEKVRRNYKCHQIKILRSMLTTVKAAFAKLIQDHKATRDCAECEEELTINRNDQMYLMTLMEFIMHGLAPLQKTSELVKDALEKFNQTNIDVINNRVSGYLT